MKAQHKDTEQSFFDEYAEKEAYDVFAPRTYRRLLRELEGAREGLEGWQIDLGCGTGAFTRYILSPSYKTVAVDLSYQCLWRVHSQIDQVFPVQGDIERLPFGDNSVSFIIFSGVLHHLPDLSQTAAEAYRVLKPGGRGFAYDPHEYNPLMYLFRSPRSPVSTNAGRTPNERNLTKSELKAVFEGAGFTGVKVKSVSGMLFQKVARQNRLTLGLYNGFELVLQFTCLEKLIGSFLLTTYQKPE